MEQTLQTLTPAASLSTDPENDALFLDFDGTLVALAENPEAIIIPKALPSLLSELQTIYNGAVAIVTGRHPDTIRDYIGDAVKCISGLHGLLHVKDGKLAHAAHCLDELKNATKEAAEFLMTFVSKHEGLILENKGYTIAVHYRSAPSLITQIESTLHQYITHSKAPWCLQSGQYVFELKPQCVSKGHAVDYWLTQTPFKNRRAIFIGDDVTDEAGFSATKKTGGHGIQVGQCKTSTLANYYLPDTSEVLSWLCRSSLATTD